MLLSIFMTLLGCGSFLALMYLCDGAPGLSRPSREAKHAEHLRERLYLLFQHRRECRNLAQDYERRREWEQVAVLMAEMEDATRKIDLIEGDLERLEREKQDRKFRRLTSGNGGS